MTLSKLINKAVEEMNKPSWYDSECEVGLTGGGKCDCQIVDIKSFLTKYIQEAYQAGKKEAKPKDKLGEDFTKFLESEGYEVIDCTPDDQL